MSTPNYSQVLGVLAGSDMSSSQLRDWAAAATFLIAADGGYNRLQEVGIVPDVVVGDMDSAVDPPGYLTVADPDQSTSDCDKLLAYASGLGLTEITLGGVEGDRIDHLLGSFASCARSSLLVRLVLRTGLAWVLRGPTEHSIRTEPGELVSLMPLEKCQGVSLVGVRWPLHEEELAPRELVSLSNRAEGEIVTASLASGSAVLFHLSPRLLTPAFGG